MIKSLFAFFLILQGAHAKAPSVPFSTSKKQEEKSLNPLTDEGKIRDYLVKRLEKLYKQLPRESSSGKAVALRLAHVLSLRADDRDCFSAKKNVTEKKTKSQSQCLKAVTTDARRALNLYKELEKPLKAKQPLLYSQLLLERAWLSQLIKDPAQAIAYLKKVIQLNVRPLLATQAHFNLGEIYFENYDYKSSLKAFDKVLQEGQNPWRLKSSYRKIWCLHNLSLHDQAVDSLERFLTSSLYREISLKKKDKKLKEKLKKELTVIYSRGQITEKRLAFLYNFEEDTTKNKRLTSLAEALNRIGRIQSSNKVWEWLLRKKLSPQKQMAVFSSMMDNWFILGDEALFIKGQEGVEKLFVMKKQHVACSKELCQKIKEQQKKYILTLEKHLPDRLSSKKEHLFSLYKKYNSLYPERDMIFQSALLARDLKQYGLAQDLFQQAALFRENDPQQSSKTREDKEKVSILQMQIAEISGDKERQFKGYDFYLTHGKNETLLFQTRYRRASLLFQNKKYREAAESFKNLALSKESGTNRKTKALLFKAAHLSLAALISLKERDDDLIASQAKTFMDRFPEQEKIFLRIHHTALLNRVKSLVSDRDFASYPLSPSSDEKLLKAWDTLHLLNISKATKKEKTKYCMDKLLLAKELLKLKEMDEANRCLLADNSLSQEDRQTVLTWKLWLAEMRLDFKEALKLVKSFSSGKDTKEELLRLAVLSELARENFITPYEKFIKKYPHSPKVPEIVIHIIEKAPKKERKTLLNRHVMYLSSHPEILSELLLKLDKGELNEKFMKPFLKLPFMKFSSLAGFLKRKKFIEEFEKESLPLKKFSLSSSRSYRLRRTLKRYDTLLNRLEGKTRQALELQDWTSQIIAFSTLKKELIRFHKEVLNLPLPKNLTPEEQKQYTHLLRQTMAPYKKKTLQIESQLKKLWAEEYLSSYRESYRAQPLFHSPLQWEIQQIKKAAPLALRQGLNQLLEEIKPPSSIEKQSVPSREIEKIHASIKNNPFNDKSLNQLLRLEKARGNRTLAHYIENRLQKLKKYQRRVKL